MDNNTYRAVQAISPGRLQLTPMRSSDGSMLWVPACEVGRKASAWA